ncbi:putative ABC transporter ATP-binding protein [Armadillidium nasatum]|uniref:Putative ABC transporter ATP-binding protein n=2 Tax=Armadillidium nasatum TaxID=96803 RepID=A0A5N5TAI9_9CRUS|nr:putative ABC transporter ATP-binding protein [Armadillidium nasatum]
MFSDLFGKIEGKKLLVLVENGTLAKVKIFSLDKENLSKSDEPKDSVVVEKASFSYGISKEDQVVLTDISTSIEKGKVTMVLGSVGTGKSSFLLALLGEITKVAGTVQWNRDGNVAFVSQNPWLINASLRENILMGKRFISRKYNNVISLCALKQDIALLPDGDRLDIRIH